MGESAALAKSSSIALVSSTVNQRTPSGGDANSNIFWRPVNGVFSFASMAGVQPNSAAIPTTWNAKAKSTPSVGAPNCDLAISSANCSPNGRSLGI